MNDKYNELQAKTLHHMAMAREHVEMAIACNVEITNLQGKGLKLVDPVTPEVRICEECRHDGLQMNYPGPCTGCGLDGELRNFVLADDIKIAEERVKAITPDTKWITSEEMAKLHPDIYGLPPKGEKNTVNKSISKMVAAMKARDSAELLYPDGVDSESKIQYIAKETQKLYLYMTQKNPKGEK